MNKPITIFTAILTVRKAQSLFPNVITLLTALGLVPSQITFKLKVVNTIFCEITDDGDTILNSYTASALHIVGVIYSGVQTGNTNHKVSGQQINDESLKTVLKTMKLSEIEVEIE